MTRRKARRRARAIYKFKCIGCWFLLLLSYGIGIYAFILDAFFNASDVWFVAVVLLCFGLQFCAISLIDELEKDWKGAI